MKLIAHRGNIDGSNPLEENRPEYIENAIESGYDVEIDIRYEKNVDGLYLGHDEPQYKVDHNWLDKRRHYLWLHCKNLEAAKECWAYHSFCHTSDSFVYTSTGVIWLHDLSQRIDHNTIIPLIDREDVESFMPGYEKPFGICTDYPALL
jgi:hypothetical protein